MFMWKCLSQCCQLLRNCLLCQLLAGRNTQHSFLVLEIKIVSQCYLVQLTQKYAGWTITFFCLNESRTVLIYFYLRSKLFLSFNFNNVGKSVLVAKLFPLYFSDQKYCFSIFRIHLCKKNFCCLWANCFMQLTFSVQFSDAE